MRIINTFILLMFLVTPIFGATLHINGISSLITSLNNIKIGKNWRSDPLPVLPLIYFSSNILDEKSSKASISVAYFDSEDKKIKAFKLKHSSKIISQGFNEFVHKKLNTSQMWYFGKKYSYSVTTIAPKRSIFLLKDRILKEIIEYENSI